MLPGYALIANLRNGAWYSDNWTSYCYFKSGDGHDEEWTFSLSRLNLHIAKIAASSNGCLIVDSTRRGKVYPDSLTATIPLWCAVINFILFYDTAATATAEEASSSSPGSPPPPFASPPWMTAGHQDMLTKLVPTLVKKLSLSCREFIRQTLQGHVTAPLTVFWVAPIDGMLQWDGEGVEEIVGGDRGEGEGGWGEEEGEGGWGEGEEAGRGGSHERARSRPSRRVTPIVLLSCSDEITEAEHNSVHSWFYVKGAGDDEENWARGLTPELFWRHRETILASDDPSLVERAVMEVLHEQQAIFPSLAPSHLSSTLVSETVARSAVAVESSQSLLTECNIALHPLHSCLSAVSLLSSSSTQPSASVDGILLLLTDSEYEQFTHSPLASSLSPLRPRLLPLRYQSGKKNHSKNDFVSSLFPAVLSFYQSLLHEAGSSSSSSSLLTSRPLPTLWIARTEIHITGIDVALLTCLLLCFYDLHFHLLSRHTLSSQSAFLKTDILLMAGALQSTLPRCILNRYYVKELTSFYCSPESPWQREKGRWREGLLLQFGLGGKVEEEAGAGEREEAN
jgi:hypothetical protein